jgi:hypothetical protein
VNDGFDENLANSLRLGIEPAAIHRDASPIKSRPDSTGWAVPMDGWISRSTAADSRLAFQTTVSGTTLDK